MESAGGAEGVCSRVASLTALTTAAVEAGNVILTSEPGHDVVRAAMAAANRLSNCISESAELQGPLLEAVNAGGAPDATQRRWERVKALQAAVESASACLAALHNWMHAVGVPHLHLHDDDHSAGTPIVPSLSSAGGASSGAREGTVGGDVGSAASTPTTIVAAAEAAVRGTSATGVAAGRGATGPPYPLGRLLCGGWRNRANRRPPAPQTQPVATPLHPPFHPRCPSRVVGSVWTACRPRGQLLAMRLAAPPPCLMGIVQGSPRRPWRGQRGMETSSLAAGRQMSRGACPNCRTSLQHPPATCLTHRRRRRLCLRCSRWPAVWPLLAWAAMERRPALPTPPCRWAHTIRLDRRRCRCP